MVEISTWRTLCDVDSNIVVAKFIIAKATLSSSRVGNNCSIEEDDGSYSSESAIKNPPLEFSLQSNNHEVLIGFKVVIATRSNVSTHIYSNCTNRKYSVAQFSFLRHRVAARISNNSFHK